MNDDFFAKLIFDDLRNEISEENLSILHESSNLKKWRRGLDAILCRFEEKLADLEYEETADESRYVSLGREGKKLLKMATEHYSSKKNRLKKFIFRISQRLEYVDTLVQEEFYSEFEPAIELAAAIKKHKQTIESMGIEPNVWDIELWQNVKHEA